MRTRRSAVLGVALFVLGLLFLNIAFGGPSASSFSGSGIPYDGNNFIEAKFGQPVDAAPYTVTFRSTHDRMMWENPYRVWPWDKTKYIVADVTLKNTSSLAVNYDASDWNLCDKQPSSRSSFSRGRLAPNQEVSGSLYFDLTRTGGTCSLEFLPANTPWHIHSTAVKI